MTHINAIGHVNKCHSNGRLAWNSAGSKGRNHGIEERKHDGGTHSSQKGPPRNCLSLNHHQTPPALSAPTQKSIVNRQSSMPLTRRVVIGMEDSAQSLE